MKEINNTFCGSLGMNDFRYSRAINSYVASIKIPSLRMGDNVSVIIHNHNFSYDHFCLNGELLIITSTKPINSVQIKVCIEN